MSWKALREKVIRDQGETCELCGAFWYNVVHHWWYGENKDSVVPITEAIRVVDSWGTQFSVLCASCHKKVHSSEWLELSTEYQNKMELENYGKNTKH